MSLKDILTNLGISEENLCEKWNSLVSITLEKDRLPIDENKLIMQIENEQETLFSNTPVMGATRWFVTKIKPLQDNYIAVLMEDGHIQNCAIIKYDANTKKLYLIMESKNIW